MKPSVKSTWERMRDWVRTLDPRLRMLIGILFIALGLLALVTPLTPGSWLVFVGLELIGFRLAIWHNITAWWTGRKDSEDEGSQEL